MLKLTFIGSEYDNGTIFDEYVDENGKKYFIKRVFAGLFSEEEPDVDISDEVEFEIEG